MACAYLELSKRFEVWISNTESAPIFKPYRNWLCFGSCFPQDLSQEPEARNSMFAGFIATKAGPAARRGAGDKNRNIVEEILAIRESIQKSSWLRQARTGRDPRLDPFVAAASGEVTR